MGVRLWLRQFRALYCKNWIVLRYHWFLNLLRCLLLPVGYGIFISLAQLFLVRPNQLGLGNAVPIFSLDQVFPSDGSLALVFAGSPKTRDLEQEILSRATSSFSQTQLNSIVHLNSSDQVPSLCKPNFNWISECFAAVIFNFDDNDTISYTLQADAGLLFVDVLGHRSDFERRVLPLQWAIDQAIVTHNVNMSLPTPLQLPYTIETDEEQALDIRFRYLRGIRSLLVLALAIAFLGIPYHLSGTYISERSSGMSALMGSMGCGNAVRMVSFHLAISSAYVPAWIIVGLAFHFRIFTSSSASVVVSLHVILGLTLASYALFLSVPFSRSPALAALFTTFLSMLVFIIALVLSNTSRSTGIGTYLFSLVFPPAFYVFAIHAIVGWEIALNGTRIGASEVMSPAPGSDFTIGGLIAVALITIFLFPFIAFLLERHFYEPKPPHLKRSGTSQMPRTTAISIRAVTKTFRTRRYKRHRITAIDKLSMDIPAGGIFVLLGSNGAGKSTLLSMLIGDLTPTEGEITFGENSNLSIGFVPQRDVFIHELTSEQTIRLFCALKCGLTSSKSERAEEVVELLRDVGLRTKHDICPHKLSGGMRRRLQLAIGLAGHSQLLFVDECTSGVDPLSRRSLWRTLRTVSQKHTIIMTTHFLDEADLLGNNVAILRAPGKLMAQGTPVELKSSHGHGYTIDVQFQPLVERNLGDRDFSGDLLTSIRELAPHATCYHTPRSLRASYNLGIKDDSAVGRILRFLDDSRSFFYISNFDVRGSSLEDIFLQLMREKSSNESPSETIASSELVLSRGKKVTVLAQALTVFEKRRKIMRRSWLSTLMMMVIVLCGTCIPLFFLNGRTESCTVDFTTAISIPLFLPASPLLGGLLTPGGFNTSILQEPPGIIETLGIFRTGLNTTNASSRATFLKEIESNFKNFSVGGISVDAADFSVLVAWEASIPSLTGPTLLNTASNILLNAALNKSDLKPNQTEIISANYEPFPTVDISGLFALKWVAFFGATMGVWPAFYALYIAKERATGVQAMQFSNGLSRPMALWLGHLMFDAVSCILIASAVSFAFAVTSNAHQFHGLGYFWICLVLYGLTGILFAYTIASITSTPLAAFAVVAGYQVLMFILYLSGYLLTLTYSKTSDSNQIISIINYSISVLSPVANIMRACLISLNLFSLLCTDDTLTKNSLGDISKFGGPILYLLVMGFSLFLSLTFTENGGAYRGLKLAIDRKLATRRSSHRPQEIDNEKHIKDVIRIAGVSKRYSKSSGPVLQDINLSIAQNAIFALLGPNGAGKTTLLNVIRGDMLPDCGDVLIRRISVLRHPITTRLFIGVCPQFTAIDTELTVYDHMATYGRFKGLNIRDAENDIRTLLDATGLTDYSDRLAKDLSGGNQRKLALAIAMLGNPAVILVDEFSTGIDPKTKRELWRTVKRLSAGKAMILTTHSMEEAAVLSTQVGILQRTMLASGTTASMEAEHASYEVQFSVRTLAELQKTREIMNTLVGSRLMDDVATRYEVPITKEWTIASLFQTLCAHKADLVDFAIEKASLESVFLRLIKAHNIDGDQ